MLKLKGFSLIEILVALVILTLLATFAHTEYLSYVVRAEVTEAMNILSQYQEEAQALRARYATIAPYYVLFTDTDQTGLLTGTPTGTSASKQVNLQYVNNVVAISGISGSSSYILLGAQLQHNSVITTGADFVYLAGVQASNGTLSWKCGISVSQGNTINSKYLPQTCQNSLP